MIFQCLRHLLRAVARQARNAPASTIVVVPPDDVGAALSRLPVLSRAVFALHARDGLSFAEIGDRLDLSLAEVEDRLADALQTLDREIGDISAAPAVAPRKERG